MEARELSPETQVVPLALHRARIEQLADRVAEMRAELAEVEETCAALVAANQRLGAELADMTLQRDELLNAVEAWNGADWKRGRRGYSAATKLLDALMYCHEWTPADRARDAQEREGRKAAADEAALRYGG